MRVLSVLLACWICGTVQAESPALHAVREIAQAAVLKVRVHSRNGAVAHGSAVVLGAGIVVTNCHVVSPADRIDLLHGAHRRLATLKEQNVDRDVCLLDAPGLGEGVPQRRSSALVEREKVYAIGFPAGADVTITQGEVIALHDYDGAAVIQVSAASTTAQAAAVSLTARVVWSACSRSKHGLVDPSILQCLPLGFRWAQGRSDWQ